MPAVAYVPDQSAVVVHDSLRGSLAVADEAQQCAVLWFAEVKRRKLYRELGFSSIYQYAMQGLDFSRSRARDFIRLAKKLDELPAVRAAVADGKLGYTKAREVVDVATPETEDRWLEVAEGPREDLVKEVKKVKRAARVDPNQGELLPALVERLHVLGGVPTDRAELLLEALATLVEARESDNTDSHAEKGPRGPRTSRPPVQIHVHQDAATGRMTVQTDTGEHELGGSVSQSVERRGTQATNRPRAHGELAEVVQVVVGIGAYVVWEAGDKQAVLQNTGLRDLQPLIAKPGASALAGVKQFVSGGIVHNANEQTLVRHQPNRHRIKRYSVSIVGCAVNGVDQPEIFHIVCLPLGTARGVRVGHLLGQDAILRVGLQDASHQHLLRLQIVVGNEICGALARYLQRGSLPLKKEPACTAGEFHC